MQIGVPKETGGGKKDYRAILMPPEVRKIVDAGHEVFVESGFAKKIYVDDSDYRKAGASILKDKKSLYSKDLVVKLKFPNSKELQLMHNNILFSMIHPEQNPSYVKSLKKNKIIGVSMELIFNKHGERFVDCTALTGEQAMIFGFNLSLKSPKECKVLILGYGRTGSAAIEVASKLGATVKVLRRIEHKHVSHFLKGTDLLVNALSWPKAYRDKKKRLVTKQMLSLMNRGGIIVDIAVDDPGPIETTRATQMNNPWYEVRGIKHICIYGYPALAPISSSETYSRQILPLLLDIANNGIKKVKPCIKKAIVDSL